MRAFFLETVIIINIFVWADGSGMGQEGMELTNETTSMGIQRTPERHAQMSFPFQGRDTGQHRPQNWRKSDKLKNTFYYNHPKNIDHKKPCNEGKIVLAVKKRFFVF